jgi:hypothetical protein
LTYQRQDVAATAVVKTGNPSVMLSLFTSQLQYKQLEKLAIAALE